MKGTLLIALGLAAAACRSGEAAEPKAIAPENARQHVGETCSVTFQVKHTKYGVNRKIYFLDSREDFTSAENLGVQVSEEMAAKLKEKNGVVDPHVYYADKTIRVIGKIFLQEDRPSLRIDDVEHIQLADDAK